MLRHEAELALIRKLLLLPELVESIAATFQRLYPLVVLAATDRPITTVVGPPEEGYTQPLYPIESLESDTELARETLTRWMNAIERKGQAIIAGPPGTGTRDPPRRSRLARRRARAGAR